MTAIAFLLVLGCSLILALVSCVDLLYFESLRLRSRDLPALAYFKETLETELGMAPERGALSFSLLRHALLILTTGACLCAVVGNRPVTLLSIAEALVAGGLILLIGAYLAPQLTYRTTTGQWLGPLAPLLRLLALLVRPLAASLEFVQSLATPHGEQKGAEEPASPAENIEALIDAGTEEGLIEEGDRELIQSVVEFGDKTVRQVMTPRPEMVVISAEASLEDLRSLVIHEQYSRIPVYEQSIDDIIGFVHVRDMFELEEEMRSSLKVRELIRPIRLVPETKRAQDLLREMQQDSTHMVIVVDEYGNTAGLATMEDLVELIVGEIRDEHEPGSDVTPDGEGRYIVSGSLVIDRLHDLFEFRPEAQTESTTVGGLVSEWLGRVPATGESVERDGLRIEVLASNGLRVEQVRISRSQPVSNE